MADLRDADYGGAHFYVLKDDYATGRRLVVHEFPHRDVPYVEDLGRKAPTETVTAYVVSDSADSQAAALRSACQSRGPKRLNLPLDSMLAHCQSFQRSHERDRMGLVAFQITFVRDGSSAAPLPLAYLSRLVFAGLGPVVSALSGYFSARYSNLGVTGFVRDSAVARIQANVAAIESVRSVTGFKAAKAPAVLRAVGDLYADAATLSDAGALGDSYGATVYANTAAASSSDLPSRVSDVLETFRDAAEDAETAAAALYELSTATVTETGRLLTPSARREAANNAVIDTVFRVAALASWAVAVSEREFVDPRSARQARADVAELINFEIERLTSSGSDAADAVDALRDIQGATVRFLSSTAADLAPVVTAASVEGMPSLWWANALYGDAMRAEELSQRNRVIHPLFMPSEFEALNS